MPKFSVYLPDDLFQRMMLETSTESISGLIQKALKAYLPAVPTCKCCGQELPPHWEDTHG